jgi:thiol-disulfide isomerase/thioredoxin
MKVRWAIATLAAVALAALVLNTTLNWTREGTSVPPEGAACAPDARPANLDFALKDLNNEDVKLADYLGKVILLDFWATWCGPCQIEIPGFIELQNQYGPQGFQVLGVSVDDTLDKLQPYAADMKMNYPVLQGLGRDDFFSAYPPIVGLPLTMIISRDGLICSTHAGFTTKDTFEREIRSLL